MTEALPQAFAETAPVPQHSVLIDRVPSLIQVKEQLIDRYAALVETQGWVPATELAWWQLCLEELLTNAMLHGNEGDPDLLVEVEFGCDDQAWTCRITDHGEGFDPSAQRLSSGDDDTLLREHGRGIVLVREWVDDLRYYDSGRTAWLKRRIQPTGDD